MVRWICLIILFQWYGSRIWNLLDSLTWNDWYAQPSHHRRPNSMSSRGLNLEYHATKVSCLSDYQKSKSFGLQNFYHFGQAFDFLDRMSSWSKLTFVLDINIIRNKIASSFQYGSLFCISQFSWVSRMKSIQKLHKIETKFDEFATIPFIPAELPRRIPKLKVLFVQFCMLLECWYTI